jgi:hypothetical protein
VARPASQGPRLDLILLDLILLDLILLDLILLDLIPCPRH